MAAKKLSASEQFFRLYRRLAAAEARIGEALNKQSATWLGTQNVFGFAVGHKGKRLAAVFFVTRKVPARQLPAKHRLPRFISVNGKRVPTDVVVATPLTLTAAIGDPTENQKDHITESSGDVPMGTRIKVSFSGAELGTGTAGALVRKTGETAPLMLSCAHVLMKEPMDVAQWRKVIQRIPLPVKLNNHFGQVVRVAPMGTADAGYCEIQNGKKEVLHIGVPRKADVPPTLLSWVQKSGGTTGLTYGRVTRSNGTLATKDQMGNPVTLNGLYFVADHCAEANDVTKLGDPDLEQRFLGKGDSGSLVMKGNPVNPADLGEPTLQKKYNDASATEQQKIRDGIERVAVGLLVAQTREATSQPIAGASPLVMQVSYGVVQDINLALNALGVELIVA